MRHRFFFVWTLAFIGVLVGLLLSGMFQSYDRDGPQILVLFFVCNYYVISLQILWQLSMGQMAQVTKAVLDVKEDIRDGVIKNVDQSSLNNSQIPADGDISPSVITINESLKYSNKEAQKLTSETLPNDTVQAPSSPDQILSSAPKLDIKGE